MIKCGSLLRLIELRRDLAIRQTENYRMVKMDEEIKRVHLMKRRNSVIDIKYAIARLTDEGFRLKQFTQTNDRR